jgi:hypothetical protein
MGPPPGPPLPGSAPQGSTSRNTFLTAYAAVAAAGEDSQPCFDLPKCKEDRYAHIRSEFEQYVVGAFQVPDDCRAIWNQKE